MIPICIAFRGIRFLTTVAGMCVREKDRQTHGLVWTFEISKPTSSGIPSSARTHLLILQTADDWGLNIQTFEPVVEGAFSFKPRHHANTEHSKVLWLY